MMGGVIEASLLLLIPVVPLVLAGGLLLWPQKAVLITLAPWAALPALVCAVAFGPVPDVDLPWLLLGVRLGLDDTAQVFLFFTGLLWLAGGIYATAYLADDARKTAFFAYFLLAMSGNLGLIIAQDMLTFYALFALMSFASYGLIAHTRTPEALHAGRIYIVMVVVGELLLFAAMVLAAHAAGSILFADARAAVMGADTRGWILALALSGFGIKLGLLGLHFWLPLAHPVAPTPASAILSGAMIKTGLLGWMQMLPLGESGLPFGWGGVMMAIGLVAMAYAVVIGLAQRNPKTVLAYSSVSQMGLVTMAIGLGLAVPSRWPDIAPIVLFLALHHALAKGALFLGVGVSTLRFAADWRRWLLAAGLVLPALALAGAPLTSGGLVKVFLEREVTALPVPWGSALFTLLGWTVVTTTLLMVRFLTLVWPRPSTATSDGDARLWAPWAVLTLVLLALPFHSGLAGAGLVWTVPKVLSGFGMVALGVAVAALGVWLVARIGDRYIPRPPAGDLGVLLAAGVGYIGALVLRIAEAIGRRQRRGAMTIKTSMIHLRGLAARDITLTFTWPLACTLFLLLVVLFIAVAAL